MAETARHFGLHSRWISGEPSVWVPPSVSFVGGHPLWADIGVVFLMFGLGLEFSFK